MTDRAREPIDPDEDRTLPLGVPVDMSGAPPEPRRRSVFRRVLKWVGLVLAGYYVFCLLLLIVFRFVNPPTTGVQAQRRIEALVSGDEYSKRRIFVAADDLPRHVGRAVVAAEDGRFWTHHGFDWREMFAAGRDAASGGRIRGASTITQQLMKNLFGTTHGNLIRKLYDLALTPAAELILGKERILELYLNQVEWGEGVWGVGAAARHHYGVSAPNLSRAQAAGLAALLPNPRQRTPGNTGGYRREILRRMGVRGW